MEDLLLNSENEPWRLYFSKALFEGLSFGGAKVYEGKFAFQKRLGLLVVGRKFTIFALFLLCIRG